MTGGSPLDRLAALYGIRPEYHDIWGRRHEVPEATKRALLVAMGVPADTGDEIHRALEAHDRAARERVLPPVEVVRQGAAPFRVACHLPARRGESPVRWVLIEEGGTRHEGAFTPADTPPDAETTVGICRYSFHLPVTPPPGYHRLLFEGFDPKAETTLIVAPEACYEPPAFAGNARLWGLMVQLYAVRSQRNWGIGDFTDLRNTFDFAAAHGAALVGVSPLHALFPDDPERASPYSPSSRLFLNALYLDPEAIPEFAECEPASGTAGDPEFQAALAALRSEELVFYRDVAARKLAVCRLLYRCFRERHLETGDTRGRAFRAYQSREGAPLRKQALFEALSARFSRGRPTGSGWSSWPEEYRYPDSRAVAAFEAANIRDIEFFEYLQWQASEQLAAAGRRSGELNLGIGLYQDLATGIDPEGGEVWAERQFYALGTRFGAPPDDFNLEGQDWGLPPPIPHRLREAAYAPFVRTLRRNMQYAGALRIDHVMALSRLFWIPAGMSPEDGAYVSYPLEDLLGILALESQRNRCLVIGEDLGTVPVEIRERLPAMGILSCRLLYFEKTADGGFKRPSDYANRALVAVSTHDLPTLAGYWQGTDLELRSDLGLFGSEEARRNQIAARSEDRARLLLALDAERLLPEGVSFDPLSVPRLTPELRLAVHRYLARTPARLMVIQAEDCLGQALQVNLPGTTGQYPNWRRKLSLGLEAWSGDRDIGELIRAIAAERRSS